MSSSTKEPKSMQIPLQEISLATDGFSEKNIIAAGGFGKVYRGESAKHGIIAVKRLFREKGQGNHEFKTEIEMLSSCQHENIVSFHGFCDEGGEKILVYKLERNGSLDKHLTSKDLGWIQRIRICIDAARGLQYLHDNVGTQHRILHRDIKSANILLDENFKAKISDFGLSIIGPANMQSTFVIADTVGTFGYIDPEYYATHHLTQKSDVFSFGVVLFEVLCGRFAYVPKYEDDRVFLSVLAQKHYKRQTLEKIIHSDLQNQINAASLHMFSTIAYQCFKNAKERPTMKEVVKQLQKALDNQLAPSGIWSDVYDGFSDTEDGDFASLQQSGMVTSASHSASTGSSPLWNNDVFISFRGEDTCKTFVDHLYSALVQQGIHTYIDDETLLSGENSPALLKAISESRISIIVFSKNYALSSWCLDELEYIMKCKDERGQLFIPIFYDVHPSDVRRQKGAFGEAFLKNESKDRKKAESWRQALVDAAGIAGWELKNTVNGHEAQAIRQIVYAISNRLLASNPSTEARAKTSDDTSLIGIEPRMQDLKSVLEIESGGVLIVGICGIWGSGKSALATSLYEEISHEFEGCCFVKNVCAESRMHGLKALQEKILSDVLGREVLLTSIEQGTSMMKRRLSQNSVLIVLDDVGHIDHLNKLAGSHDWFGDGSRIIITTRNKDLVIAHNVNRIHHVRMLDVNEAIKLFIRCAFVAGRPLKGYKEVSLNIVSKFGGHPSALISIGSFLQGKDMSEWMSILAKLEGIGADALIEKFKDGDDGVKRYIHSWLVTSGDGSKDMETKVLFGCHKQEVTNTINAIKYVWHKYSLKCWNK